MDMFGPSYLRRDLCHRRRLQKLKGGLVMGKKPQYYVTESKFYPDWWIVLQKSNDVVVAHVPSETIAELFTEFLNQLPGKRQPKRKRKAIYPHLKKKNDLQ